ncbi:MAG: TonB family protein [Acidobacteriaceae bacterium]
MTTLMQISALPLVHALGWTLLHLCWQGTGVALVLWSVLQVLDGRSPRLRYAAACLALGMMIVLPLATFAHLASADHPPQTAMDGPAAVLDAGMVLQVSAVETSAPWPERIAAALDHALPWIILAWLAGVVLFVVRLNVGLMVARRMRSIATTAVPAELQQAFDEIRRRLDVTSAVRLMHSALVQVPTVIGWLRPVVLIPASCLSGLSTMQIEAILAHELAHIRRHDYLVSVLQSVIETLLFYHPAVWWVSRQVRRERECCCDEMAVAVGGDRLAYARALSVLEERRAALPEFVLGANGGVLTMRIRRLLGCKEDAAVSQLAAYAVLTVLLAVAGAYVVTAARAEVNALSHAVRTASPMELEAASPLNALIAAPVVREFRLKAPVMMAQAEAPEAPASPPQSPPKSFDRAVTAMLDGPAHDLGPGYGMISWSFPVYPPEAKAAGIQGVVALKVTITNTGTVEDIQVISGPQELRQSTIDAVKQWKFDPSWDHGYSVGVKTIGAIYSLPSVAPVVGPAPPADEAAAGVKQFGGDVTAPRIISEPWPGYTELARRDKVEGVVTVGLVVDEHGLPQHVKLLRGLGDGLDEKAVEAVKKYVFKPAMENGKPVAVYLNVEVKFQLADIPAQTQVQSGGSQGAVPEPPPPPTHRLVPSLPPVPGNPVRISAGTAAGMLLSKVDPVYPENAKAAHVQGPVVLLAIISKTGTVKNLDVVTGNGMLVEAACDAVSQWTYKPYLLNGQPTEVEAGITVNFSLADSLAQGTAQAQPRVFGDPNSPLMRNSMGNGIGTGTWSGSDNPSLAGPVKQIGGDVKGPVPIYQPEPEFTKEAKKAKMQGVVTVGLIVDEHGVPQNVHVIHGLGIGPDGKPDPTFKKAWRKAADGMNKSAVDAVTKYRFKPASENGKPVAVYLNVEVNFEIF